MARAGAGSGGCRSRQRPREQERLRERCCAATAPETLLLCEHDPVVTLGRSANPAHVLASRDELARRGVDAAAPRRAAATSPTTGPGSWSAIRSCGCAGASSATSRPWRGRSPPCWASWVSTPAGGARRRAVGGRCDSERGASSERGAKICAFGVHVHRRVAIHGFALNVSGALDGFDRDRPVRPADGADDVDRRRDRRRAIGATAARARFARRGRARSRARRRLHSSRSTHPVESRALKCRNGITRMIHA